MEHGDQLSGRILLSRTDTGNTGEISGCGHRVLTGVDVFDGTEWAADPRPIGFDLECPTGVRAPARRTAAS